MAGPRAFGVVSSLRAFQDQGLEPAALIEAARVLQAFIIMKRV
jgi:hypothetical protein